MDFLPIKTAECKTVKILLKPLTESAVGHACTESLYTRRPFACQLKSAEIIHEQIKMHQSNINKQDHVHYCIAEFGVHFLSACYKWLFPETWGWDTCSVHSQPYTVENLCLKPLRTSDLLQQTHASAFGHFTNHCWRGSHRVKHLLRPVKLKPSLGCGTGANERLKSDTGTSKPSGNEALPRAVV